ncbi:alpha/beta fold hydrolase [Kineococcus sp. DHX-1]|uniref:alpha/beta fold hydrolase n=1 Tax=Kineococcus sp. DHX-1 TaxID=3349638 RepID=UPI0036D3430D
MHPTTGSVAASPCPGRGGVQRCGLPTPVLSVPEPSSVLTRHCVTEAGDPDGPVLLLAHGFGAGQSAWQRLLPHFTDHRVVLFDYAGSGSTRMADFDPVRHGTLTGYAQDLLEVCAALDLQDVNVVAHSVSGVVSLLAAAAQPDRFASLSLVAPSPRYVDEPETGWTGGFSLEDIHELLESLDSNYYAWSAAMAPVVMGTPQDPDLGAELTESFLGTHPDAAAAFARAIFLSDARDVLPRVQLPTLVLQCRHDALAPEAVGAAVAAALPHGHLVALDATGHCPHISAPVQTATAVRAHLAAHLARP